MSLTLLLVAMVIFAFGCSHWLAQRASPRASATGVEYVVLGWLLGPQLQPHVLTTEYLETLAPLISLMLGLVGFIVGLRARRLVVRADAGLAGTLVALAVTAAVGLAALLLQYQLLPAPAGQPWAIDWPIAEIGGWLLELRATSSQLWLALTLGAAACVCGSAVVERAVQSTPGSGRSRGFLTSVASGTEVVALILLGITLAAARSGEGQARYGMGVTEWVVAAIGLGVLCGALFTLLIGRERDPMRMFLTSVGVVTFASGIGSALGVSPLFVNLLLGVTVAAASPHADELLREVTRLSQPVNVLVLVFAGALWSPAQGWQWFFPLAYIVVRYIALRVATPFVARHALEDPLRTERLGHALLGQGGIAVAIGVSVALRFEEHSAVVLTTVLASTLWSAIWSRDAVRSVLLDADDQTPGASPSNLEERAAGVTTVDEAASASEPAPSVGALVTDEVSG